MEIAIEEIVLPGSKEAALPPGNIEAQFFPIGIGMPDEGVAQLQAKVKQTCMGMFCSFAIYQYPVHRMIISERITCFFEPLRGYDSCCGRAQKRPHSPGFPGSGSGGPHFFDFCPGRALQWLGGLDRK